MLMQMARFAVYRDEELGLGQYVDELQFLLTRMAGYVYVRERLVNHVGAAAH